MVSRPSNETDPQAHLNELIRRVAVAMLTTAASDGSLRSRPMASLRIEEDGGAVWFLTDTESGKVDEIRHDADVNLSYADPAKHSFASVAGRAEVVRDRRQIADLWRADLRRWFPNGPDDPHLAALRVRIVHAEYWDEQSGQMIHVTGGTSRA